MADETVNDAEFYDDLGVEIGEDEASSKILGLNKKISDLERENETIVRENKEYKQRIEELKRSVEKSSSENAELKKQVEKAESENKALEAVAARAAELETEAARLQMDLVSAMSDLQDSNGELSNLKSELKGRDNREMEKDVKLEAVVAENCLLVAKVEKLVGLESSLRVELQGKEKEIQVLKKNIGELETVVGGNMSLANLKDQLEKKIEKMKVEISVLAISLDEKEKVISEYESKERAVPNDGNGGEKKALMGGLERDWVVLGASTVVAVAVVGVTCYVHASRKH